VLRIAVGEAERDALPTAAPQLIVGSLTGRTARRIGSRAQLLVGVALMLAGYVALAPAHRHAWELVLATSALGLGLGFGVGAVANLIVVGVGPRQTGVATATNTVMRTLGGAFAACAGALTLSVAAVLAIPGTRLRARRDLLGLGRATSSSCRAV
jgi:predicted MFS family arabinose efflux permease